MKQTKTCINCNTDFTTRFDTVKFCSKKCYHKSRLGKPRPESTTKGMREGFNKWKNENPKKFKEISINNLPKDITKEKNGNWKNGKTQEYKNFRIKNYTKYRKWRNSCLERDNYTCKLCGSKEKLQVHHIIPIAENREVAWLRMNGVTLCNKCHFENDNYWQGKRINENQRLKNENFGTIIKTIRPEFQEYETAGNYQLTDSGKPVIFITEQKCEDYEFMIAIHELVEEYLNRKAGITIKQVDDYDFQWEENEKKGLTKASQPGDEQDCPYREQHMFATIIEGLVATQLGIDFSKYDKEIIVK